MSADQEPVVQTAEVGDRRLTVAKFGSGPASIVMLHDGLGSIAQWREVPAQIAQATGAAVVAYDRAGHGLSTPRTPASIDWLHDEALVLARLLEVLQISNPTVVGHSDGGSIALIHAATGGRCAGVVTFAAHGFVEDVCVERINAMVSNSGPIVIGLAKYHEAPKELFQSWSRVWTDPSFRSWDIRSRLAPIDCPVLMVQGEDDEFASDAQLTLTAEAIGANASILRLPDVGHVIHHQSPESVVNIVAKFHQHA